MYIYIYIYVYIYFKDKTDPSIAIDQDQPNISSTWHNFKRGAFSRPKPQCTIVDKIEQYIW